ncbi:MAG: hypothetical protein PUE04_07095 [Lachnospira sp.]|nr:hypothetical protein [Lachnospira sp.]
MEEYRKAERERLRQELTDTIVRMGYPAELAAVLAMNLKTEKAMGRMCGYLHEAHPRSAEEIADEMMAILSDRENWIAKKEAQYYNARYNSWVRKGLKPDEEGE